MIRYPDDSFGGVPLFNGHSNGHDQVVVHNYEDSEENTSGLVDELHFGVQVTYVNDRRKQGPSQPLTGRSALGTVLRH